MGPAPPVVKYANHDIYYSEGDVTTSPHTPDGWSIPLANLGSLVWLSKDDNITSDDGWMTEEEKERQSSSAKAAQE
jgi:hypothetical protein